jgi:hypothetical protein
MCSEPFRDKQLVQPGQVNDERYHGMVAYVMAGSSMLEKEPAKTVQSAVVGIQSIIHTANTCLGRETIGLDEAMEHVVGAPNRKSASIAA